MADKFVEMRVDDIVPNPNQPRQTFDEESLRELADSIAADGLQQPILVRPIKGDSQNVKYEIVQGERRWRAHKLAGLETIRAFIKEMSDEDAFHLSVIENIQREQLTPIEEAQAYLKYLKMGYTQEQVAKKVNKSRTHIASRLRLLKLNESIQKFISEGKLKDGHAKQILKMEEFTNRLCKIHFVAGTPFEYFQHRFIDYYWHRHKFEKISVEEVKDWVDKLHANLVWWAVNVYKGRGGVPEAKTDSGHILTSNFFYIVYEIDMSKITVEDIDFAVSYFRNYCEKSNEFDDYFRPYHIEMIFDDVRRKLLKGEKLEFTGEIKKEDVIINPQDYSSLSYDLDTIKKEIKHYQSQLEMVTRLSGTTVDELIDEFSDGKIKSVSRDTSEKDL